MTTFLIGCTHFGHNNIIRLANRPFNSIEEQDETLIKNWNGIVGKKDTVYHLGDFSYKASGDPRARFLNRLNGDIRLIQGNHDRPGWGKDMITIRDGKRKIVLCHYPIEEWDGWYRDAVHFHCHTHKPEFKTAERRGNVGVDSTDFKPIALEEAIERVT